MTPALRWAAMRAILMFHNCEEQSHKTVHKPQLLKWKQSRSRFEPRSLCLPAWRLTAWPLWPVAFLSLQSERRELICCLMQLVRLEFIMLCLERTGWNWCAAVLTVRLCWHTICLRSSPNIQKIQQDAYLLWHKHTICKFLGVIPFVKLQNDT